MKFRKGYTLIELIVSISIFGIITISFLSIFNVSLQNIVRAGNRTTAVEVASKNIINVEQIEDFNIDVKLPGITEKVTVAGTKVTGNAEILNSNTDDVSIYTYVPIK